MTLLEAKHAMMNDLPIECDGRRYVRIECIAEHKNSREDCNTHTNILRRDMNRRGNVWTNDPYSSIVWYDARVIDRDGSLRTVNIRELRLAGNAMDELEEVAER